MCLVPREKAKSVVTSLRDKIASMAEEKNHSACSLIISRIGKIANPRELKAQLQIIFKGQMHYYFFPPMDFIRNEVTHTHGEARLIWVNIGNNKNSDFASGVQMVKWCSGNFFLQK